MVVACDNVEAAALETVVRDWGMSVVTLLAGEHSLPTFMNPALHTQATLPLESSSHLELTPHGLSSKHGCAENGKRILLMVTCVNELFDCIVMKLKTRIRKLILNITKIERSIIGLKHTYWLFPHIKAIYTNDVEH